MIWILDNGEDYSDHAIVFVDAPEAFDMAGYLEAVLRRRYAIYGGYDESGSASFEAWAKTHRRSWYVVGVATSVTWFDGGTLPLEKMPERIDIDHYETDPPTVDWRAFVK